MDEIEPLRLSRDIERTARRATLWQRRLRDGEGFDADPFEPERWVSGRDTFQHVSEMNAEDPLRGPLRRWVYRLAELRINRATLCRVTADYRIATRRIETPEHGERPLAAVLHRALSDAPRRKAWLAAYLGAAEPLGETTRHLWERRSEVGSRMGVALDQIEGIGISCDEAATLWLDRTHDLYEEHRTNGLADFVTSALGTDANEGWPSRIAADTFADWYRDTDLFRSLDVEPGRFVTPLAASSFLRALQSLGAAWSDAAAANDQPFVVAHDPYGLRRRTFGALFGAMPTEVGFASRRLGLARSRIADHRRRLARVRLLDSRAAALKAMVRNAALGGSDALARRFEELCERALGFGLPRAAALTIFRPAVDESQRFVSRFLAASQAQALREAHDEDWFRNPRAVDQLRAEAALSPETTTTKEALEAGMAALRAEIAGAMG